MFKNLPQRRGDWLHHSSWKQVAGHKLGRVSGAGTGSRQPLRGELARVGGRELAKEAWVHWGTTWEAEKVDLTDAWR